MSVGFTPGISPMYTMRAFALPVDRPPLAHK